MVESNGERGRSRGEGRSRKSGQGSEHRIDVSVVVPAYRARLTLGRCLASILGQDYAGALEVLLCADAESVEGLTALQDGRVRLVTREPGLSAAAARNRAVKDARGRALAFTDSDVVVSEDWLRRLVEASGDRLCVAGSVVNGTKESLVGSAEYFTEFIDLHPNRKPSSVHFGATCNLFLPRDLFDEVGPFAEDLGGAEDTIITTRLRRRDLFVFEPRAQATHHNRTEFWRFMRHQYEFGRFSARAARTVPGIASSHFRQTLQAHALLAPFAALGKLAWIYSRIVTLDRGLLPMAVRCAPFIVAGVTSWTAGLVWEAVVLRSGKGTRIVPPGFPFGTLRRKVSKR